MEKFKSLTRKVITCQSNLQNDDHDNMELELQKKKAKRLRVLCSPTKRAKASVDDRVDEAKQLLQSNPKIVNMTSQDGQTPLHLAAINEQPELMAVLIRNGANIEQKDTVKNYTPLLYAIANHSPLCFSVLLDNKAETNAQGSHGQSVLHVAVENHTDSGFMVKQLLTNGADVNKTDKDNRTPLHLAAMMGNHCVLQNLLKDDLNYINRKDGKCHTPLHWAAKIGHRDCCVELLKSGARGSDVNKEGNTPLMLAVNNSFEKTCRVLLEFYPEAIHIANKEKKTPLISAANKKRGDSASVLRLLLSYKPDLQASTSTGDTALHIAAREGISEMCSDLIKAGADCNSQNQQDMTPLHYATKKNFPECVAILLGLPLAENCDESIQSDDLSNHRANNFQEDKMDNTDIAAVNTKDCHGKAPIHYSLEKGAEECCSLLIRKRANVRLIDGESNTPLHIAAAKGLDKCCSRIIAKGVDVDAKNGDDRTPLHLAARAKSLPCCQTLVKKGAKLNVYDKEKMTPLHYAAVVGSIECCEFLLKKSEKSLAVDRGATSPLHLAAKEGHLNCCEELVKNTLMRKYLVKKDEGMLPYYIAFSRGKDDTFCFLFKKTLAYLEAEKNENSRPNTRKEMPILFEPPLNKLLYQCISERRSKAADALVKCSRWGEAFNPQSSCAFDTNFSLLIEHFPDIAKTVLDNCVVNDGNGNKAYLFYLLQDTYYCCSEGGDDTLDGGFLNMIAVPLKMYEVSTNLFKYMENLLKKYVPYGKIICEGSEFVISYIKKVCCYFLETIVYPSDFKESLETPTDEWVRSKIPSWVPFNADGSLKPLAQQKPICELELREKHYLHCMVKHKRLELLEHELCQRLLNYKWDRYVGNLFYFLIAVSGLFVVILSLYVTVAYDWVYVHQVFNITRSEVCEHFCKRTLEDSPSSRAHQWSLSEEWFPGEIMDGSTNHNIVKTMALITLIVASSIDIWKIYHLQGINRRAQILFKFVYYSSAFVLLWDWTECADFTGIREDWQWMCGVLSVMLAWFDFMMLLGRIPHFGIYLFIINDLMKTMLKLFLFFVLQVIAFSVAFQMLMRDRFVFSNYARTIMKILTMTLGELSYDDHFSNEASPLRYPLISNILLICFLGLISVLMLNFVSNFSQDELDKAKKQAKLINLSGHVNMTLEMESMFPMVRRRYTIGWVVDKISCHESNSKFAHHPASSDTPQDANDNDNVSGVSRIRCEFADVKRTLVDLTSQIREMQDDLRRVPKISKIRYGENKDAIA